MAQPWARGGESLCRGLLPATQLLYTPTRFPARLIRMGNIRPTYIKRVGEELMLKFPDQFGTSFEENKKKVSELTDLSSTSMRNRVAGYVTRLVKIRMRSDAGAVR
jgi:small subunit ribosomal protein S17e